MKIEFQPQAVSLRFELPVTAYFALAQFLFGLIGMMGNSGLPLRLMIFWTVWPAFLLVGSLIVYGLMPHHVILRCTIIVLSGIGAALIKYFSVSTGIIDPVYIFLMTAAYAMTIAIYGGQFLFEQLENVKDIDQFSEPLSDFLDSIVSNFRYFLTRAFQGFLALGASLGVSMSILFQGGFDDSDLKFNALKMLLGFILVSLALGLWMPLPLILRSRS